MNEDPRLPIERAIHKGALGQIEMSGPVRVDLGDVRSEE
jgi:hypothetical protein